MGYFSRRGISYVNVQPNLLHLGVKEDYGLSMLEISIVNKGLFRRKIAETFEYIIKANEKDLRITNVDEFGTLDVIINNKPHELHPIHRSIN